MVNDLKRPFIHKLLDDPMTGTEIETASFAAIDAEAPPHNLERREWEIVRRMVHTTADFGLIPHVMFSSGAVSAGIRALKQGSPIYVDSNMIRVGISMARLRRVFGDYGSTDLHCHVADSDIASQAEDHRLPRALFAVRRARKEIDQGIVLFGNSPVGLLELNRLILEEGIRPKLVVGMPVGFVHVMESKQELMTMDVPWITLSGRRGGSPLAVSVIHAIATLASTEGF